MDGLFAAYFRASVAGAVLSLVYLTFRRVLPRGIGLLWREASCFILVLYLIAPVGISTPASVYTLIPPEVRSEMATILPEERTSSAEIGEMISAERVAMPPKSLDFTECACIVWLIGFLIVMGATFGRATYAYRKMGNERIRDAFGIAVLREAACAVGLKRAPVLRRYSGGPVVRGLFRAEILLSDDVLKLPAEALYMIFLHECAHVKRGDVLRLWALNVVEAIHWWNPMIRVATRFMRRDIELFCDALALKNIPQRSRRVDYGRMLISMASSRARLMLAASGADVKERIFMIKTFKKSKTPLAILSAILCCLLTAGFLTLPPVAARSDEQATIDAPRVGALTNWEKVKAFWSSVAARNDEPETLDAPQYGVLMEWEEVKTLWAKGEATIVVDFYTGKEFSVTLIPLAGRSALHADFEATSAEDTAVLKECYGGEWRWERRPVLVLIGGEWVAASISGWPHGEESVEGNDMVGNLCMHFLNSKTHGALKIDDEHQNAIYTAAGK